MDLFVGYAGLAVAFVIMMSILLAIFIKATNISWKIKFTVIPLVLWYSIALYNVPGNFMGWPTEKITGLNEVFILAYRIEENKAIYFWIIDYDTGNSRVIIDPSGAFTPYIEGTPRLIKIKYNSKIHDALLEALKKQQAGDGRFGLAMNLNKLRSFLALGDKEPLFELIDPEELLDKDGEH